MIDQEPPASAATKTCPGRNPVQFTSQDQDCPMICLSLRRMRVVVVLATIVLILPATSHAHDRSVSSRSSGRTPWTTSKITGSPDPSSPYRIERAFPHLSFRQPTVLTQSPGSSRWYLAELAGKIFSFADDPAVRQEDTDLFVDLRQHIERVSHIYGMTFHPDFQQNGYVYICYLHGEGFAGNDRVSQFEVTRTDPPRCDPSTEKLLIEWPTGGHNGCCLKFGPDGYLYITAGDGASPSPPDNHNTGQDISDIKASILRIDVDRSEKGRPYAVPADNPFVDHPGARPEIWAYGFRNPWKMSFDSVTGDLWVGDVGWDMWEMVFRVEKGGNYGWSIVEGGQPVRSDVTPGPTPIQMPVAIHPRNEFRSITGGYVYHGRLLPDLEGTYLYGDYVTGQLWGLRYDGEQVTSKRELVDTRLPIITCAVDHDGEFYIVDYGKPPNGGSIYRLQPNDTTAVNSDFPTLLSDTGLFSSVADHKFAEGVIPYSVSAEPWADGAVVRRAVAVPGRNQVGIYKEDQLLKGQRKGAFNFPGDSVLVRTLSLNLISSGTSALRPIETQILHRDGSAWRAYTFAWDEDSSDASLVPRAGARRVVQVVDPTAPGGSRQQTWRFSGRQECQVCHTLRSGSVLGFRPEQLSHQHRETHTSQLQMLTDSGLFSQPVAAASSPLPSPSDLTVSLEQRARSYLDVNCSHCHGNGNAGTAQFRLQHRLPLSQTGLLNSALNQGDFGIFEPRILAPGDPYRSVLYYRMAKLGKGRMPHIGSYMLDRSGLQLIHDWIQALPEAAYSTSSKPLKLKSQRNRQQQNVFKLISGTVSVVDFVEQILDTPSGGLIVQRQLLSSAFSSATRDEVVRLAAALKNPHIQELFVDFVPEQDRPDEADLNPSYVLGLSGDSERGKRLFATDQRLQCRKCHKVGNTGGDFGPGLTTIGRKNQPRDLLASILTPSSRISPEYIPWLLVTKDGIPHSGLLVRRNAEGVTLRTSEGKTIHVPTDQIEEMVAQDVSFMPKDALRDVTAEEAADLLAYLTSLK